MKSKHTKALNMKITWKQKQQKKNEIKKKENIVKIKKKKTEREKR